MDDRDVEVDDGEDGDEWGLADRGPFRDGKVHVLDGKCSTCIFRPGNLMRLAPGRVKGMVAEAVEGQSCIPCHSTLGTGSPAICRGYWDGYAGRVVPLRLAVALEMIVFEAPPSKDEVWGEGRGQGT